MSVELVNLSFKVTGISSSEHSILNVLAFRANKTGECWPSVKSLCESTSLNRKTVYQSLISLTEKGLIAKTGEMKGRTKSVPVYKLSLPKNGHAQKSSVPVFSGSLPKNGHAKLTQNWYTERSFINDNRKELFSLLKPKTTTQMTMVHSLQSTEHEPTDEVLEVLAPLIDRYLSQQGQA